LDEHAFETEIAAWLTDHAGYTAGASAHFYADRGIDTAELFAFIGATQIEDWNQLIMLQAVTRTRHNGRSRTGWQRSLTHVAR